MVTILNRNPQPRIPDAIEQRLENQVIIENELFHVLLFSCAGGKLGAIIGANYMGYLNIENPTFFDYYFMFMGFYCLFFIFLSTVIFTFHQRLMFIRNFALYIYAAAEFVLIPIAFSYLYFYGFTPAYMNIHGYYFGHLVGCVVIFGFLANRAYQWYIASKNLKLYQHGTRHRILIIPKNIKGA